MNNNYMQQEIDEMKANSLRDKISALNKAREEGEQSKAIEIAKNLLDILDNDTIALKTGLTVEEVEALRIK